MSTIPAIPQEAMELSGKIAESIAKSEAAERPKMSLTLYQAEENYLALLDTEEMVEADQELAFKSELEVALKTVKNKRDRVAEFLLMCEAQIAEAKAEKKRMDDRMKRFTTASDRMKGFIKSIIQTFGTDAKGKYPKLEGNKSTLSLRKSPDAVKIEDENAIPIEYKRVTVTMPATEWHALLAKAQAAYSLDDDVKVEYETSKTAIKEAWKAGTPVDGTDIEADYSVQVS